MRCAHGVRTRARRVVQTPAPTHREKCVSNKFSGQAVGSGVNVPRQLALPPP